MQKDSSFGEAELAPVRLLITQEAILAYASLTGDFNPLHVDPEFARTTPMGGVIAHGTLSLNLLWQALSVNWGVDKVLGGELNVRFLKPVRIGDEVVARGQRISGDSTQYAVWVENQAGTRVIDGTFTPDPGSS